MSLKPFPPHSSGKTAARTWGQALRWGSLGLLLGLVACSDSGSSEILGTVEWDQVALLAEADEPVVSVEVTEGQTVRQGAVLVRLDATRAQGAVAQLDAETRRWQAFLDAQEQGNRTQTIAQARAQQQQAKTLADNAAQELQRMQGLRARGTVSVAEFDRAQAQARAARAQQQAAQATLDLALAGSRPEEIRQAQAMLQAVQAQRAVAQVTLERHTVRAPRDGQVDALPVRVGDQVRRGTPLATLLVGTHPYAQVFVSARDKAKFRNGDRFSVRVQGMQQAYEGILRHVQQQASFTPYYALTGDDASRLVYLAKIDLTDPQAPQLPAGLPLQARWLGTTAP